MPWRKRRKIKAPDFPVVVGKMAAFVMFDGRYNTNFDFWAALYFMHSSIPLYVVAMDENAREHVMAVNASQGWGLLANVSLPRGVNGARHLVATRRLWPTAQYFALYWLQVQRFLEEGLDIVHFDLDCFFFADPWLSLAHRELRDADLVAPAGNLGKGKLPAALNNGFSFLRKNWKTLAFVDRMVRYVSDPSSNCTSIQAPLMLNLYNMGCKWSDEDGEIRMRCGDLKIVIFTKGYHHVGSCVKRPPCDEKDKLDPECTATVAENAEHCEKRGIITVHSKSIYHMLLREACCRRSTYAHLEPTHKECKTEWHRLNTYWQKKMRPGERVAHCGDGTFAAPQKAPARMAKRMKVQTQLEFARDAADRAVLCTLVQICASIPALLLLLLCWISNKHRRLWA